MIIPDATVDLEVQLASLSGGERDALYFPSRTSREDIAPRGRFFSVDIRGEEFGVQEYGVAVFQDPSEAAQYPALVRELGLTQANALILGYQQFDKPLTGGGKTVSVLRNHAVLFDECTTQEMEEYQIVTLATRFPKDRVICQPPVHALRDRVARYSPMDRERFASSVRQVLAFLAGGNT